MLVLLPQPGWGVVHGPWNYLRWKHHHLRWADRLLGIVAQLRIEHAVEVVAALELPQLAEAGFRAQC